MTDERTNEFPGVDPDDDETKVDARDAVDREAQPDTDEANPLLREGTNAPDAADIDDPDEQL
jgi:hypothetical protein